MESDLPGEGKHFSSFLLLGMQAAESGTCMREPLSGHPNSILSEFSTRSLLIFTSLTSDDGKL